MSESLPAKIPTLSFNRIAVLEIKPDPSQPRKKRNEQADKELTESIRIHGVLQPILVRKDGEQYVIIFGERRWQAVSALGWESIDCVVTATVDDKQVQVIQLIENVQRDDLTAEDLAAHLNALMALFAEEDDRTTMRMLAAITGKSLGWVSEKLALARLPADVRALKDSNAVKNSRVLIGLSRLNEKNPEAAASLIKEIEAGKTVTVDLINEVRGSQRKKSARVAKEKVTLEDIPSSVLQPKETPDSSSKSVATEGAIVGPVEVKPVQRKKRVVEVAQMIGISTDLSPEEMLEAFAEAYAQLLQKSEVG